MKACRIVVSLVMGAALAACETPTQPAQPAGPRLEALTGTLTGSSPVAARPFALAISSKGEVFVGQQDVPFVRRAALPDTLFNDSMRVGSDPTDITFSANGQRVYITDQFSNSLGVARLHSTALDDSIPLGASPFRVILNPKGTDAFVTLNVGSVVDVDLKSGAIVRTWTLDGPANGVAFAADGVTLYASTVTGDLHLLNTRTGSDSVLALGGTLQDVVVSGDGTVYVANESGGLWVIDATGPHQVAAIAGVFALKGSPDGQFLFASQSSAGQVLVIDRASLTVTNTLAVGGTPRRIAFDPTGALAMITNEAGFVSIVR